MEIQKKKIKMNLSIFLFSQKFSSEKKISLKEFLYRLPLYYILDTFSPYI